MYWTESRTQPKLQENQPKVQDDSDDNNSMEMAEDVNNRYTGGSNTQKKQFQNIVAKTSLSPNNASQY